MTWQAAALVAADPMLAPLRAATAAEIVAATDRAMARAATPDRISALIAARLAEDPRNWVALDALAAVAAERAVPLPETFADLRAADFGMLAMADDCLACAWDIRACTLSNVLVCKGPILLTPVEDVRGLVKAGTDWMLGDEIDEVDLALSVVGLGATALVLASGGSSATLKAGAALARAARGMRVLSPALEASVIAGVRAGADLPALARARSLDDVARAFRPDALAPLARLAEDAGRMRAALGTEGALHLMRLADSGAEATRVADAAVALGPRAVGRAEVLGKTRFLRATVRLVDTGWALVAGIAGLVWSVGTMLAGLAGQGAVRVLRRLARPAPR
ncbi:MAG: hypothetical protein KF887_17695 [Paracoccaceae bacterium]|nr:MAG: hypothetical protein KF887_17695 [Paracoccaceae bacterium]